MSTLTIIIPAYNEERTIARILEKVCAVKLINDIAKEIIIVNDGSTDATAMRAQELIAAHPLEKIRLFEQPHNMGKGAAIHKLRQ